MVCLMSIDLPCFLLILFLWNYKKYPTLKFFFPSSTLPSAASETASGAM